jgi:hypothetical protein
MRTGSTTSVAVFTRAGGWFRPTGGRVHPRPRKKLDPRTRILRTFVLTFTTWSLFLCYLLVFAV